MEEGVKREKEKPAEAATARQGLGFLNPSEHRQRRQLGDGTCTWEWWVHISLSVWGPTLNSETLGSNITEAVGGVIPTTEVTHIA